jgi:signal transduction histidine kinase/ActR/RegA family two-component response regulator
MEHRALILAPLGKDATLIEAVLREADISCLVCSSLDHLARELERGVAAVLIAEEALATPDGRLEGFIARQAPWSDLPVLLITQPGADSPIAKWALEVLGNVTLLERPMRVAALASTVRSALRSRRRQYETRAHLEEREQADRRKDEFLATLAHELRNPLAPIRNAVSLLRISDAGGAGAGNVWEIMDRQVSHMVRLVDDLMEVSRITRGNIELRRDAVDLAAVIAAAVETSQPLVESRKHQLTVTLAEGPLVVDGDAMRLAQVFSNLLNNAVKYTDPGGRIDVKALRGDGHATVTVADTGIGISAAALPRVFDMFVQGDPRDDRQRSGLGIGLTLVRSLVEMHGGTVAARSAGEGKGTEFIVRLPLANRNAAHRDAAAVARVNGLPRVLVVDDNQDSADSLGALLQLLGADVRVTLSGQAALGMLDEFHPAAIFLDLGMPGMNGYETASRIRARPEGPAAKLIALTGWGQEEDRRRTHAAGFNYHLVKPADIGALQTVLASLVEDKVGRA